MPRGGPRSGKPGGNYSNRSDLQNSPRLAPAAPQGQPYGEAGSQLAAQATIPMGPAPIPLGAPTSLPAEPVQSGLSMGPGPGPEAIQQSPDPTIAELRGLYAMFPNRDLAELLEDIDNGQTF